MTEKQSRPVVVTTEFRGVFFGYLKAENDKTVVLTDARNAIYWATKGGFVELASFGPNSNSRIGDKAKEIKLHGVTSITECTSYAEAAWNR